MLQRTCSGKVVKQGIRNHPWYGVPYAAEAIFFRKPDGTPWVKFFEGGFSIVAPVVEVGKMVQWTGREERLRNGINLSYQYTAWAEDDNKLNGSLYVDPVNDRANINHGGTVDLVCSTESVPAPRWSSLYLNPTEYPPGDPP